MCGIAGMLTTGAVSADRVAAMTDALSHRGPDDRGVWLDEDAGISLGHRRLSILDLSPLGHQPMASASGRYLLAYNGEIYDHLEIRAELEAAGTAPAWRGTSDTETLLAAIDAWGLQTTLARATGMFAIALWDRQERTLALARDRFGEKPLFYGWVAGSFAFASELGAIRTLPGFDNPIDRHALSTLLSRTYIPAPLSIYRHIFKLMPGTILRVSRDAITTRRDAPFEGGEAGISLGSYWSYRDVVRNGLADPFADETTATDAVEAALTSAIARQSIADVPVGAFLSGGLDSSTVVALYQAVSSMPIRTFSIGFEEAGFDEAVYARQVARHFGTEHHELYVGADDALAIVPRLSAMYGEPFADSSAVPTHLVSAFAKTAVTVALSGDGGDELFGGYNRYLHAPRLWRTLSRLPHPARRMLAGTAAKLPDSAWTTLGSIATRRRRPPFFGAKVSKVLATAATARGFDDVFASLLDEWYLVDTPVLGIDGRRRAGIDMDLGEDAPDVVRMMYADATSYMSDDILAKVDRAAMACSLETRVPFLDHHLAAVAARVPMAAKIAGTSTKHVLRNVLYRHAPRAMFDRPKAGFALPIGGWLRGPLRDWAEDLLDPARMRDEGYLAPAPIYARWQAHLAGTREDTPALWAVLMFQAWLRQDGA